MKGPPLYPTIIIAQRNNGVSGTKGWPSKQNWFYGRYGFGTVVNVNSINY